MTQYVSTIKNLASHERANRCTEDEKQEIIRASNAIKGKLQPSKGDLKFLFEMFDKYVKPYPLDENLGCNGCRKQVRGFWERMVTKVWI